MECLGAGTARLLAGLVRPDAVVAEADRAPLCLLGDALAREHVPLLRRVGPVHVILTVVVVAAAGILDARGLFDTARRLFALGASKSVFLVALQYRGSTKVRPSFLAQDATSATTPMFLFICSKAESMPT